MTKATIDYKKAFRVLFVLLALMWFFKYVNLHIFLAVHDIHTFTIHPKTNVRSWLGALLYAPGAETFVFQLLIIEIIRRALNLLPVKGSPLTVNIIAGCFSAIAFFAVHYFGNSPLNGVSAGISGGILLAYAYLLARPYGVKAAFVFTTALHFASNASLYIATWLLGGFTIINWFS